MTAVAIMKNVCETCHAYFEPPAAFTRARHCFACAAVFMDDYESLQVMRRRVDEAESLELELSLTKDDLAEKEDVVVEFRHEARLLLEITQEAWSSYVKMADAMEDAEIKIAPWTRDQRKLRARLVALERAARTNRNR